MQGRLRETSSRAIPATKGHGRKRESQVSRAELHVVGLSPCSARGSQLSCSEGWPPDAAVPATAATCSPGPGAQKRRRPLTALRGVGFVGGCSRSLPRSTTPLLHWRDGGAVCLWSSKEPKAGSQQGSLGSFVKPHSLSKVLNKVS